MKSFTPLLLIVLSVALFFTFIDKQYELVKELNQRIQENNEVIALGNELRDKHNTIVGDYKKLPVGEGGTEKRSVETLRRMLPNEADNVRLIIEIDNLAQNIHSQATSPNNTNPSAGIVISNINVGGEAGRGSGRQTSAQAASETADYEPIQISFDLEAGYGEFKTFLMQLEDSLRIVDVVDIKVSPIEQQGPGPEKLKYSMIINAYWLK